MEGIKERVKLGQVTLRRAEWRDFPLFMKWRNLPHVYENMVECPYPPSEEEVARWLGSYVNDVEERYGFLVLFEVDGASVGWGLARDFQSGIPEVGITIADKDYWGTGLVEVAAKLGFEKVKLHGFRKVRATAMNNNDRILGFLRRTGWEKIYKLPENPRTLVLGECQECESHSAWVKDILKEVDLK